MINPTKPVIAGLALLAVAACSETRSTTTEGLVVGLDGHPVANAEVHASAPQTSPTVQTEAEGRFTLTVEREFSSVPLPASGVFVAPVEVEARAGDRVAFSSASALSTADRTHSDAILILVPEATLRFAPECDAMDPTGRYAFALADQLDPNASWLASLRQGEDLYPLHQRLRGAVAQATRACGLGSEDWQSAYDALDAALEPEANR